MTGFYIISGIFLILLTVLYVTTYSSRKKARAQIIKELNKSSRLNWVLAGSEEEDGCETTSSKVDIAALGRYEYKKQDGEILEPQDHKLFVVIGESMRFAGIHNHDLIFSTKKFNFDKLKDGTPQILVIHKRHPKENRPAYKLRRTWKVTQYNDNLLDEIKEILDSEAFKSVRSLSVYDGDSNLIEDFANTRVPKYCRDFISCDNPDEKDRQIVISTTFHTDTEEIRFSIHPVSRIVGQVVASFKLAEEQFVKS